MYGDGGAAVGLGSVDDVVVRAIHLPLHQPQQARDCEGQRQIDQRNYEVYFKVLEIGAGTGLVGKRIREKNQGIENPKDYYKAIIYYISGMTDNYAIETFNRIIKF